MRRDITANDVWRIRQRGLLPNPNPERYVNPDVARLVARMHELSLEWDSIDATIKRMAEEE